MPMSHSNASYLDASNPESPVYRMINLKIVGHFRHPFYIVYKVKRKSRMSNSVGEVKEGGSQKFVADKYGVAKSTVIKNSMSYEDEVTLSKKRCIVCQPNVIL